MVADPAKEPLLTNGHSNGYDHHGGAELSKTVHVAGKSVLVFNDDIMGRIRRDNGIPDSFLEGLQLDKMPNEGKGGSPLYLTDDRKYIIKEISDGDHKTLLHMVHKYAKQLLDGPRGRQSTLLVPIYLHFMWEEDALKAGKKKVQRLICMANLFPAFLPWDEKYDLKGCDDDKTMAFKGKVVSAVHKRFWMLHMWCGTCAWSQDRWRYYEGKVHARALELFFPKSHRDDILERIRADTQFLIDEGIMDYSLMVGIRRMRPDDYKPHAHGIYEWAFKTADDEVVVVAMGIIDFLQPWTTGKTVAMYIKSLERNKATVPPPTYGERFRSHFEKRFQAHSNLKPI